MKRVIALISILSLLLSGCGKNGESLTQKNEGNSAPPEDITVIKWGMQDLGANEGKLPFEALNKRLEEEGSDIRIEFVGLDIYADRSFTFPTLVEEYEKENGSFDIVTYGSDWEDKRGTANIFLESGYFRELKEEDKARFKDIPDICWKAGKVNGKHYTVPALNFGLGKNMGIYFYFNMKYISKDKLKSFTGSVSELEEILSEVAPGKSLIGLDYGYDYLMFTEYTQDSEKGGLFLSHKTMKAMNPYEAEEVIEQAAALNKLYKKGFFNYEINFSDWEEDQKYLDMDFAVTVGDNGIREGFTERLGKDYNVVEYSFPYYMENRILYSTGIPAESSCPKKAMELLIRLHGDKELSGLLTESERDAIGLPRDNRPVETGETKLSPFAGFELKYTDIDAEIYALLVSSFDRLCKAEDFDNTLEEINAELKAAGIDGYVEKVNKLLEESDAASNQ